MKVRNKGKRGSLDTLDTLEYSLVREIIDISDRISYEDGSLVPK